MPSNCETVRSVFEEAQRGFQHHAKLIRALKKIQDGHSSLDEFLETFVEHLRHAMIVFKREPAVERIIEFVAKYSTSKVHYEASKQKTDNLSDDEDAESCNNFLRSIIKFILDCHDAKDKAVRLRACQLIHKILSNMDDEACIDDDIADSILTHMLKRLTDKFPPVRVQAVYGLSRLQDPTDEECPVMTSYSHMMATDSSADVRKAVLLNVALNRKTLLEVVERTHDVTETVRKLAYRIIAEKVKIQSLSIAVRVQLLQDGLNDRSQAIQDVCAKNLLQGWLKSLQGNVIDLLKSLDIENSADTAEKAIKVILKVMSKEELQEQIKTLQSDPSASGPVSIPYDGLDCESAFYWRCLGQHLKSLGVEGEDLFDLLLPEVSGFCEYLQEYIDKMFTTIPETIEGKVLQKTFIAQQLLMLLGVVDLSDEVGRKHLGQLIHDILVSPYTPESLVELLLTRHSEVQQEEDLRIQELVEIIADVRQPIVVESAVSKEEERQKELKLASIKVKLMQISDELENCVSTQDFTKAAELKQQITELEDERSAINESVSSVSMAVREEKDDPVTLLKCLTIACEMLQPVARNGLNPTLLTLVDTLVIPGIQNEDPQVRNAAVKCLGLCALLSCEFARNHLLLFLQVAQVDLEIVQLTALQVVFDLLLKFGLEAFKLNPNKDLLNKDQDETEQSDDNEKDNNGTENEQENEGDEEKEGHAPDTTAMSVLGILTGLLESESNDIRNVAAEGLAKLLLSGRVLSAKLLSHLILLWYNPTTEEDGNLRHCIGVFLPVFAFASRSNQELVEEAFLPTLKTLFSAPTSSPLASINSNNVAELLIELTNSKHLTCNSATSSTEGCSHVALALKVANEVLTDPQAPGTRVLCKVLTSLDLDGCDQTSVGDLKVLSCQLFEAVEDSGCTKLLDKFQNALDQMDTTTNQDEGMDDNEETPENNSNDAEQESADTLTSSQEKEVTFNAAANDDAASTDVTAMTEDSQTDRLKDNTNTQDVSTHQEHERLTSEVSEREELPTKTPKSKVRPTRKQNTASKTRMSTTKRTQPKRNAQSMSTIKYKLDLSDSDISDKENAAVV